MAKELETLRQANLRRPQVDVSKEVEDARKAVYEKNKKIGEMFNRQTDLEREVALKDAEIERLRGA